MPGIPENGLKTSKFAICGRFRGKIKIDIYSGI